jgi:tRNA nucleotidyltransferase/poly(A) polymerase
VVDLKQLGPEFSKRITPELHLILNTLIKNKKDAYIIGGAVRDFIFGQKVKDFDIATNAEPDQIVKWLADVQVRTKPIGGKWGTVLAITSGKQAFDVSTYRKEVFHTYGQPPEVIFIDSLDDDLRRRDFTINTIVYDPFSHQIIDKYHGVEDIKNGTISMIGDPNIRLLEDGLRIIRLSRFMSKFNLTPTKEITIAVQKIGKNAKFRSKRVMQFELFKLLRLQNSGVGFNFLIKMNILPSMFPNFPFTTKYKDNDSLGLLEQYCELPITNETTRLFGLLLLLSDENLLSENHFKQVEEDLLLSNRQCLHLNRLYVSWINFPSKPDPKTIKRWVRAAGINASENLVKIYFLNLQRNNLCSKAVLEDTFFRNVQIAVNRLRNG